jgi:hypothetical protein
MVVGGPREGLQLMHLVTSTKLLIIVQKFDATGISTYKFSLKSDCMWEKVKEQIRAAA